jgi:hypothetical protein
MIAVLGHAMFEHFPYLAAFLALGAVAAVAFARPEGVVWRAGLAAAVIAICAGIAFKIAQDSNVALLWRGPAALRIGLCAALFLCAGALLRHALNALGAWMLRG